MNDKKNETSLFANYAATTFYADVPNRLAIRIGQTNTDLDALLRRHAAQSWAFITAFNPGSRLLPAEENARRQADLEAEVAPAFRFFFGEGIGDCGDWPAERSLLILGIGRSTAVELGRRHGQAAIVAGVMGGIPELIPC